VEGLSHDRSRCDGSLDTEVNLEIQISKSKCQMNVKVQNQNFHI
jgi:hypothetical protein